MDKTKKWLNDFGYNVTQYVNCSGSMTHASNRTTLANVSGSIANASVSWTIGNDTSGSYATEDGLARGDWNGNVLFGCTGSVWTAADTIAGGHVAKDSGVCTVYKLNSARIIKNA